MPTEPDDLARTRSDLRQRGWAMFRYSDQPIHSYPYDTPWLDDPGFCELYEKIREHTLVDRVRCHSLHLLAGQVRDLEGDVLEIGVWRGGTAAILASNLPDKTVFLADTFEGVIKSSDWEHYRDRAHDDTSIPIVEDLLGRRLGLANHRILKGVFPDDTGPEVAGRRWSLVHIDVDVYLSARDAFHAVWRHVVPGGVVVFDDYGFFSACGGIRKLVDELKHDPDKLFIHNLNAHAYLIKRA